MAHNDSATAGAFALSLDAHGRPLLSPSAAQLWRRCNRAFGWRYLEGLRDPPKPGQRLGTAYHRALESYLLGRLRSSDELRRADFAELDDEQWRTLRRIVKAALASGAYPEPRAGVVVAIERGLSFVGARASWRGFADALLRPGAVLEVHDHKTTRSLDYGLTDETLPSDPQAVFYAAAVSHPREGTMLYALQWTYVQTHGAALVRAARCTMTATEAHERMIALDEEIGTPAVELVRVRPRVLDLAPDWSACDSFGGCPHRERCGERPILAALSAALDSPRAPGANRTGDPLSQVTMQTFAERYGTAAPAQPPLAAPVQAQPSAPSPIAQPQAPDPLAAIFAAQAQPWTQPAPSAPPPASVNDPASQGPTPGPYDAANRPGGPATAYPDLRAAAGGFAAHGAPQEATQPAAPAPPQTAPQAPPQTAPQAPPQTAPQAPPQTAPSSPQPAPSSPPPVQQPQPQQPAPQATAAAGFALIVGHIQGASPFRRAIPFEAIVQRAADVLRERHGIQDFRLAEYGRGPGMLALAIQGALLEINAGSGDAIIVGHVGPEWQAVGAGLMAQAAFTIAGSGW